MHVDVGVIVGIFALDRRTFLGWGRFEGYHVPPEAYVEGLVRDILEARSEVPEMFRDMPTLTHEELVQRVRDTKRVPRINLEGRIIWGFECWWGEEASIRRHAVEQKVELPPIEALLPLLEGFPEGHLGSLVDRRPGDRP